MSWPDYVLLALVAICAARAFGVWRRSMKSGNCCLCCGCSGDCTHCTARCGHCEDKNKPEHQ